MVRLASFALLYILTGFACSRPAAGPGAEEEGLPLPGTSFQVSGPLRYEGRIMATGNRRRPLRAALIAHNAGSDTVTVSFGECSFGLYAYREPVTSVAPVWDNRPQLDECLLIGREATIPPGGSEPFAVEPSGSRGEYARALPPGRYFFGIGFRDRNGQLTIVPAGEAQVP